MGTEITRPNYERRGGRDAIDWTDQEWTVIMPFMPRRQRIDRPRTPTLHTVMDAIVSMASTGCQWAMLPNDFSPPSTVPRDFYDGRSDGRLKSINHHVGDGVCCPRTSHRSPCAAISISGITMVFWHDDPCLGSDEA